MILEGNPKKGVEGGRKGPDWTKFRRLYVLVIFSAHSVWHQEIYTDMIWIKWIDCVHTEGYMNGGW